MNHSRSDAHLGRPRAVAAIATLAATLALALCMTHLELRAQSKSSAAPAGTRVNGRPAAPSRRQSLYERKVLPEKKFQINDLILIVVDEAGSASNNANTNLRRKYDLRAELEEWASLNLSEFQLEPDVTALPSLDLKSERKLEGRGTTDRRERITFKIMARVIDLRPNGNLVIEGRTTRRINDEESILTIFGEADPADVDERTKAIRSERIADLKLVYSGEGPVSRNLGRSILSWLLEWLWPF